jgi:hypothetical protein
MEIVFIKSANRKSANSRAHSGIAIGKSHISKFCINTQIANRQISAKYCTAVLKVVFLSDFLLRKNLSQSIVCYSIIVRRKRI